MHWDGGPFFPVVIEIRSVSDQYPEQVQVTLCSIERSNDQSAVLILKPLKQKLITDGVVFLLQEIFGIENKENAETAPPPLADENGAECIICMANSRDTMILPCRHLCICNGCAETLRYKLNNCPICRSPFKALLKVKAMRNSLIGQGVGSDGSMTTTRIRREPMTLVEAINGPFPSSAPPLPPHSAVGAGTTAGLQHNLPVAESTKSANNRQTTTATSMVARCRGSHIVTSTIVHPSPCCPSSPPPFATYQQLPLGLGSPNVGGSRRDVILIGSEMAGTAAVVDWLRGTKNAQQNEHAFVRNEALLEQIEMGHLRSRKGSHSSAVHCSSNNSFIGRSRSPSLCRTKRHRHSHFSTPNSSYQSARSVAVRVDTAEGQMAGGRGALLERQTRKSTILLASAPNLVDLTLAEVPKAISESGHTFSSSQTGAKQRKRSDTTMTEKGAHSAEGKAKRRARGAKGHVKRRSDPPRGDHDDPMML
uniref:RING-type E3 ubiquitin transferase n=1 Tax=Globodera pallida TaxID=36090 RepID=A0A183C7Y7_GLOPA